jgi:hypothetical protein
MIFDVFKQSTLESIKVYANSPGLRQFLLTDHPADINTTPTFIETKDIELTGGEHRVDLGFTLTPGTYRLYAGENDSLGIVTDLYRSTTGAEYPYTVPGLISITGNYWSFQGNLAEGWYVGYDWEVREQGCTVGIDQIDNDNISVYPNPGTDEYILRLPESLSNGPVDVRVFDIYGKAVYAESFIPNGIGKQLDLKELSAGTYVVKVKGNNLSRQMKIVKL